MVVASVSINMKNHPNSQIHKLSIFKSDPGLVCITCNGSWKEDPIAFSLTEEMRTPKSSTSATSNY